jgi:hypothetical protein
VCTGTLVLADQPVRLRRHGGRVQDPWFWRTGRSVPRSGKRANRTTPRLRQSDKISHIDIQDDHIDTAISLVLIPFDIQDDHIDMINNHVDKQYPISITSFMSDIDIGSFLITLSGGGGGGAGRPRAVTPREHVLLHGGGGGMEMARGAVRSRSLS